MAKVFAAIVGLALWLTGAARADDRVLQWDDGVAEQFAWEQFNGHYIEFAVPSDWTFAFPVEVTFYGRRFGEVGERRGTVVIWGPQTDKTPHLKDLPNAPIVYGRKQFALSDVPSDGGWVTVPIDVFQLPPTFGVSVFTYSTDQAGVEIGLSKPTGHMSHSASLTPVGPAEDEEEKKPVLPQPSYGMPKGKPDTSKIPFRIDAREWMVRIKIRPTPSAEAEVPLSELTAPNVAYFDDGNAEGFVTTQKYGMMVHFSTAQKHKVNRIYVYAKAQGDWFRTERGATIYLLDAKLAIVFRGQLPYKRFIHEPSWNYLDVPDVVVPADYYALIEPISRPELSLLLGYDSSGENKGSEYGTVGAKFRWGVEAPEEKTNWMVRVRYAEGK